jgi:hypothetical protein
MFSLNIIIIIERKSRTFYFGKISFDSMKQMQDFIGSAGQVRAMEVLRRFHSGYCSNTRIIWNTA